MPARYDRTHPRGEEGFALLTVLVAILLLSAIVLQVHYTSRVDVRMAERQASLEQARIAAAGGVTFARRLLEQDNPDYDGAGDPWTLPLELEEEGIAFSISIQDEDGKFGLGDLMDLDRAELTRRTAELTRLTRALRQSENFTPSLLDWIDEDDQPRLGGAESATYAPLGYSAKNGPLDGLLEIYRVRGAVAARPEDRVAWEDFLSSRPAGEVNVNTAPAEVLAAISEKLTPSLIQSILTHRAQTPFHKVADLKNVPGLTQEVYNDVFERLTVSSTRFTVLSRAKARDSTGFIIAELERSDSSTQLLSWSIR